MRRKQRESGVFKRESRAVEKLALGAGCALVALVALFVVWRAVRDRAGGDTMGALRASWKKYDYADVYETSARILEKTPLNNAALAYHGYSAFYLGVSQLDTAEAQDYFDEAINSLRLALIDAGKSLRAQAEYMLGKAYFFKNAAQLHYYADLAIKYLLLAREHGCAEADIPEYLGACYASLGMSMESISEFTEALLERESDWLLFSIAEQYAKAGQSAAARQYLFRVARNSDDDSLVLKSHVLLGNISMEGGDLDAAEAEFNEALSLRDDCADALYALGVLFEKRGDMAKARAQWRKALRADANHQGALKKLSQ